MTTTAKDFEPGVYAFAEAGFITQCDDHAEYLEKVAKYGEAAPYFRKANGRLFRWADGRRA